MGKTVHIIRTHHLNFDEALALAEQWQKSGEIDYNLELLSVSDAAEQRTLTFQRKGLKGELTITPKQFELNLTLGFLFSAYREKIINNINANMDELFN